MTNKPLHPLMGDDKRRFMSLALIAAKEVGFIVSDVVDLHNDRLLQLYREYGGDIWLRQNFNDGGKLEVEQAAVNFKTWLTSKAGVLTGRIKQRKIAVDRLSVTVVIPLGDRGSVQFEAQGTTPNEPDDDELQEMYGQLFHSAWQGYHEFKDHPPALNIRKPYTASAGDTANVFEFTSIRMSTDKGKRSYFVKGGAFVKYGVRVFPSVLALAGIDPESITDEKFIAGQAIYTKKGNGDPDLVIAMTKGTNSL